jgi:hypothetical protein
VFPNATQTYSIKTTNLASSISLAQAQKYFRNFVGTAPSTNRLGSTGSNAVKSTRSYNVTDAALKSTATIKETLNKVVGPTSSNSNLELRFSSANERYYSGSLVLYTDRTSVTVGQPNGQPVFIQIYKNVCQLQSGNYGAEISQACANNQKLAGQALAQKLQE